MELNTKYTPLLLRGLAGLRNASSAIFLLQEDIDGSDTGLSELERSGVTVVFYLWRDLLSSGWRIEVRRCGENAELVFRRPPVLKKEILQAQLAPRRLQLIKRDSQWIRKSEETVLAHLVDGHEIVPHRVSPEIEICTTQRQHDIWRYCRHLASVPFSERPGRRMRFLVRDASLPQRPVMAIAGLGSSLLQITCRDRWIGWNSREMWKVKKRRIGATMGLYAAIAVPPYNDLLAGKLVVYLMASNEVRDLHRRNYANRPNAVDRIWNKELVLISTSSFFPGHTSQYNRIRYQGVPLLFPVGETIGFGAMHLSHDTIEAMRRFLEMDGHNSDESFGHWRTGAMPLIRDCLNRLGFPPRHLMNHGQPRKVFLMPLAENARRFLCGDTDEIHHFDWPMNELVDYWRRRWLEMRIANPLIVKRMMAVRKDSLRLTEYLSEVG